MTGTSHFSETLEQGSFRAQVRADREQGPYTVHITGPRFRGEEHSFHTRQGALAFARIRLFEVAPESRVGAVSAIGTAMENYAENPYQPAKELATAVKNSHDSKTGDCDSTYAAQASCPSASNSSHPCPLLHNGCYAEYGNTANTTGHLNALAESKGATPLQVAEAEARAIQEKIVVPRQKVGKWKPVRLHVVGDCVTDACARIVAEACKPIQAPVWNYTHAWRSVSRSSWGKVSVLGSCETLRDCKQAMSRGYAAALVVDGYENRKPYQKDGLTIHPCPHEAINASITCTRCKLCLGADRLLREKRVIAFNKHSGGAKLVGEALARLGGEVADKSKAKNPVEEVDLQTATRMESGIRVGMTLHHRGQKYEWHDPTGESLGVEAGTQARAVELARRKFAGFLMPGSRNPGPYDKDLQRARARDKRQLSESAKKREAERRYQWLQEARGITPRSEEVAKLQRTFPVGSMVTGRFPGAGEGLYATVMGYDPDKVQAPLVLSTAGGMVTHASPADVRVTRRAVMNPKLTQAQRKWIQAVLANDESGSDEELITYFIENGLTAEQAADVVAQRGVALRDIRWRLRNPEEGAAEVYEEFHGRPSDHIEIVEETEHYHEYLAELGELQEMKVNTLTNLAATFDFHKDPPVLSSSEDRTSMYLVGGDQSINLGSIKMSGEKWVKDKVVIGVITQLTYKTEKGFDKFKVLNYYHDVGEESGVQPLLVYRTRDKRLEIVGGQYLVEPRGIVN